MGSNNQKGFISTPDDPGTSPLMLWIRDVALKWKSDECLTWPFTRINTGYGIIGRGGKTYKAHRYICQWVKGEPPTPEHHAAHSCGRGHDACVNPRHLVLADTSHKFPTAHLRTQT
jgi:hypothetical protein